MVSKNEKSVGKLEFDGWKFEINWFSIRLNQIRNHLRPYSVWLKVRNMEFSMISDFEFQTEVQFQPHFFCF